MRVSVCLGAILIPEYLDFHSSYSVPRCRIAGIYSYSGISQTNALLVCPRSGSGTLRPFTLRKEHVKYI